MRLEDIHAVIKLADIGRYSIAADELCITQSALSRRIQRTEESLGYALFNRTTRSVELTDEGEALVEYWREAYQTFLQGISEANSVAGQFSGEVTLAFSNYACSGELGLIGALLYDEFPEVGIRSSFYDNNTLLERLESGELDYGILEQQDLTDNLDSEPFIELRWTLLLPDRLAKTFAESQSLKILDGCSMYTPNQIYWPKQWGQLHQFLADSGIHCTWKTVRSGFGETQLRALRSESPVILPLRRDFAPLSGYQAFLLKELSPLTLHWVWLKQGQGSIARAQTLASVRRHVEDHYRQSRLLPK